MLTWEMFLWIFFVSPLCSLLYWQRWGRWAASFCFINRCQQNKISKRFIAIFGTTPLYQACTAGNIEIVRLLITSKGIDVNKGAPLYAACKSGHSEIARLLLTSPQLISTKDHPMELLKVRSKLRAKEDSLR